MNITANIGEQASLFVYSIVLGAGFGVLYCVFKIVKALLGNGRTVNIILDLIYFPLCALVFFFFCVEMCSGDWRLFMIIGLLLGSLSYILTIGRVLTDPVCKVISIIQKNTLKILRKIKGKIVKIPLKKNVLVLYNRFKHKRSTEDGTKSKGESEQEQNY